jgi:hypothetical protein
MSSDKNNFVFVQYAAGSCGKAISCCLQTANKVGSWWEEVPSIDSLVSLHTNDCYHAKTEPRPPYRLNWLAKTPGITRGDNLASDKVKLLLTQEESVKRITQDGKKILLAWCKNYLPDWFDDNLIQIIVDDRSLSWFTQRRKKLFYVESDGGVIETRYDSRYHTRPDRDDRRVSSLPIDELVLKQLQEETIMSDPTAYQIKLSWLLDQQWSQVFDVLETAINDTIDRAWCEQYLIAWHKKVF